MLRRLSIVGLGAPLIAFAGAMVYLLLFGTSEPTFDAATRELARAHTVLRIRDEPPAALIVPAEPLASAVLVIVLPDDERHVWSALQELGLLDYVDSHGLALLPATGSPSADQLEALMARAAEFVTIDGMYLAAFNGEPLAAVCAGGGAPPIWSGAALVEVEGAAALAACGDAPVLRLRGQDDLSARIVQWMLEQP